MDTRNLATLYDSPTMAWDGVQAVLDAGIEQEPGDQAGPGRHSCWLSTIDADGGPHVTVVGAFWDDGTFWFQSGRGTRKGKNLARDPRCAISVAVHDFDLTVEGVAELLTDPDQVAHAARTWTQQGWPAEPDDSRVAITAPYNAQSAGPSPWYVYRVRPRSAFAVQTVEPYGASRWTW